MTMDKGNFTSREVVFGGFVVNTVEPHLSGRRSSRRLGLLGSCYSKSAILLLHMLTSRLPRT